MKKTLKQDFGFTLLEVLVVILIIGMLMLLVIPNVTQHGDAAQVQTSKAFRTNLQTQYDLYELKNGSAAMTLDQLGLSEDQLIKAEEMNITINDFKIKDTSGGA